MVKESFAVVKRSDDPYSDFRRSMTEMIVEKELYEPPALEELLHCLLSLNSRHHHRTIISTFSEIWDALFPKPLRGRHQRSKKSAGSFAHFPHRPRPQGCWISISSGPRKALIPSACMHQRSKKSQRRRFASVKVINEIIGLDKEWRQHQFELEILRKDFNRINKDVAHLKIVKEDATEMINSTNGNKKLTAEKEIEVQQAKVALDSKLEIIGNLVHDSVLVSSDEANNEIV
ncbi:uncharacterized protein LOC120256751 isoform X2 [Dioscorea cayenensis subsp. rotundata]|uniref:Transcription repressor n=1 Tax=Dioscorea cayennensis subsp. rotundata TaxID=55577 RepID=A0AB40AZE4_DIOCR|nr:uncharacterized protein LOC120256751 isoform X2 [Dioscorea cayenensis subsp. rotundata]